MRDPTKGDASDRRSTIEDVAAAAGVSVATVSRAVRGLPNVAASTRNRVLETATRLGYTADPAASRLAAGRTRTIAVVVSSLDSWYFSTVVAGVEAVCSRAGYDVLVLSLSEGVNLDPLLERSLQLDRRSDGVIVVDIPVTEQQAQILHSRGVAVATVGTLGCGNPSIRIDNVKVGRLAALHLADLGHRRIGVIAGSPGEALDSDVAIDRKAGFVDTLTRHGIRWDPSLLVGGEFTTDGGYHATVTMLEFTRRPTAIFAMSDEMAFGALMALRERELVPGRDVSLLGVDDHEFARVVSLSTIRQPVAEHGSTAAQMLLESIGVARDGVSAAPPVQQVLAPLALVARSTTGPVPTRC